MPAMSIPSFGIFAASTFVSALSAAHPQDTVSSDRATVVASTITLPAFGNFGTPSVNDAGDVVFRTLGSSQDRLVVVFDESQLSDGVGPGGAVVAPAFWHLDRARIEAELANSVA